MAAAVKQYFVLKGDTTTDKFNLVIPANIRFAHYGTWDRVKFENKFAPVPLVIPLDSDLTKQVQKVAQVTKGLRGQFGDIYATYAMSYYIGMFTPYFILERFARTSSLPYTMAFSNTPGLLRPIQFEGKKSIKMTSYLIPAGHTGIGFSCLSYVDFFKIACVADTAVIADPAILVKLLEDNLNKFLAQAKAHAEETQENSNILSENMSPQRKGGM